MPFHLVISFGYLYRSVQCMILVSSLIVRTQLRKPSYMAVFLNSALSWVLQAGRAFDSIP